MRQAACILVCVYNRRLQRLEEETRDKSMMVIAKAKAYIVSVANVPLTHRLINISGYRRGAEPASSGLRVVARNRSLLSPSLPYISRFSSSLLVLFRPFRVTQDYERLCARRRCSIFFATYLPLQECLRNRGRRSYGLNR
jgi:hypothetical protein